ncbi:MAG TPA: C39 family peptidase [Candidatus Saccharimonadales bacterium]|nr:C39 family peptidase [Candidatus Saccharimonadales bacterium]
MADLLDPILPEATPPPIEPGPEQQQNDPLHQAAQQKLDELRQQKVEEIKAKLPGTQKKLFGGPSVGPKPLPTTVEKATDARGQVRAAGQIAKRGGEIAGQVAKAVAAEVERFIAANPIVWLVIAIIVVIFLLIAIVLAIFAFSRLNGGGPAIHPTTASERQQVTKLSALTGNNIANTQLVQQIVDAEKNRLSAAKAIISKVYPSDAAKATAASNDLTAIISGMDAIPKTPDLATRQKLIKDSEAALQKFAVTYPEVLGYSAVHGGYLNVPGVKEAVAHDCGAASVLMVTLYYNPTLVDPSLLDSGAHRVATLGQASGTNVCVTPDYINANTGTKDWTRGIKGSTNLDQIKKSLAGGDPVIIYGSAGAIFSNSKHIFVIVGYDPTDDTFFVNNPSPSGVQVHTKSPNSHQMTSGNLVSHLGDTRSESDGGFGHNSVMMIRSKYL